MHILAKLIKIFALLLLCILLVGLILPQHYQVRKQQEFSAELPVVKAQLNDLNLWAGWFPWRQIDPSIRIEIIPPGQGVGAHLNWQADSHYGELTVTESTPTTLGFNLLIQGSHIAYGDFRLSREYDKVLVEVTLEGEVATPVVGGYLAQLGKMVVANALSSGLNNLKTRAQMGSVSANEKYSSGSQN